MQKRKKGLVLRCGILIAIVVALVVALVLILLLNKNVTSAGTHVENTYLFIEYLRSSAVN